ncbi:unnamed protein product [Prorocentrum cordatum]|uniref:RNase H type-1 domain-containing protein n=1 Tax=Prorocentrum cordatum TaxID=2364126 RepID=A0ABN9VN28_9DINO|nr:unnamed protein product [Polarella glacialis]
MLDVIHHDDAEVLGDFAEAPRGKKGELFLRFCLSGKLRGAAQLSTGDPVTLHCDSKYVIGILTGKFQPKENVGLALLAGHLWARARSRRDIQVVWVKGHSGDYGNDCADDAARRGGDRDMHAEHWTRPFYLSDWGESAFYDAVAERADDSAAWGHLPDISGFTASVVNVALQCGSRPKRNRVQLPANDPDIMLVKTLVAERRDVRDPTHRRKLSLAICRVRRRIRKRQRALECEQAASGRGSTAVRGNRRGAGIQYLCQDAPEGQGEKINSVSGMASMLTTFFRDLFHDEAEQQAPQWALLQWRPEDLTALPQLNGALVRQAVQQLGKKKTCADDLLVAEMLEELDDDAMAMLAQLFKARILNVGPCADDGAWDVHVVKLLQKKAFKHRVRDFRPIAILPVLYKVYSKVLLIMAGDGVDKLMAPQFAFRRHHQAHEVVYILRSLVEKSLEWDLPLFVLDGDLLKAYDYTKHSTLLAGLDAKGAPRILSAAWLREIRRSGSIFALSEDIVSDCVRRSRSLLQGDPAAPVLFNVALDIPAAKFCALAERMDWGFQLDGGRRVSLLLFADNFWVVASSAAQLSAMTTAWLGIISEAGWSVPLDEVTWCSTASDEAPWSVEVGDRKLTRAKRGEGFKVLGTVLTFDNNAEVELQNRFARSWRAFYKYQHLLCCRKAPLSERLKLLQSLVSTSLFWCCGSWNLTAQQRSEIRGVQQAMLRRMMPLRRWPSETLSNFMHRLGLRVQTVKKTNGFQNWDSIYLQRMFSWAGHVARLRDYDPDRITFLVLQYRNFKWIRDRARRNGGNQMHGRKVRVWRWEHSVDSFFKGSEWQPAPRLVVAAARAHPADMDRSCGRWRVRWRRPPPRTEPPSPASWPRSGAAGPSSARWRRRCRSSARGPTASLPACRGFVGEAILCLEFAKKREAFLRLEGAQREWEHCRVVDSSLPNLGLLEERSSPRPAPTGGRLPSCSRPLAPTPGPDRSPPARMLAVLGDGCGSRPRTTSPRRGMTHDLEMNFNKIAPFGKEDTAKELQDHAAKTQDTLVDAVENAEVAEIKRAVFRALTRLRAATIKDTEFDTIARLETQAIDAYNDAHHYRADSRTPSRTCTRTRRPSRRTS